jgi:hypothetical protein
MALVLACAFVSVGFAPAQSPEDKPVAGVTLPAGLAKRLGEELPEVVWIGLHPSRDDGVWVLIDGEWTLVTGFPADARAEIKEARKRPSQTPPVRPPNVGVALHVVRFERPGAPPPPRGAPPPP